MSGQRRTSAPQLRGLRRRALHICHNRINFVDKEDSIGHMVSRVSNIRFSLKSRNAYDAKKPYNQLYCNKKTAQIDGGAALYRRWASPSGDFGFWQGKKALRMRVLVCANLLIGDAGVLSMPADILQQWHRDKIDALASVLELARAKGATACVMAGGLFAEGFVPQSLFEKAIEELGAHEVPVTWLPLEREALDLNTRVSLPANVAVVREGGDSGIEAIRIVHEAEEIAAIIDTADGTSRRTLSAMEPMGFGDQALADVLLVDVENGSAVNIEEIPCALHPFVTKVVDMSSASSSGEMLAVVQAAIDGIGEKTCLRLVLQGSINLSSYFNTSKLEQVLSGRFFYAEVANECAINLEEGELDTDVSLLAEFVRMVDSDDSLSPSEKTRIMRCGWNALNGKELAE